MLALPGAKRYAHTVKRAADWQFLWGLRSDGGGWVSAAGESGLPAFVVWPHPEYAKLCVAGAWSGSKPEALEVHEFLDQVLPGLLAEASNVAVFPTPAGAVVLVSAEQFANDLRLELSRVE